MKRLIFCLSLFSLMFTSAIASDVGRHSNDMPQNSYVVQQIFTIPVINAVSFETVQAVYNTTGTALLVSRKMEPRTFKPIQLTHVDPGRCQNRFNYIQTYNKTHTGYAQITLPTTRHVTSFVIFS